MHQALRFFELYITNSNWTKSWKVSFRFNSLSASCLLPCHVALGAVGACRGSLFPLFPLFLLNESLGVPEHEAAKKPEDDEAGLVASKNSEGSVKSVCVV